MNPYSLYYALGIDQITHISVNVLGTDPQVYFDNLRLRYVSREFVAPETETGGNSLLNFEKGYHSFVTYVTGTNYAAEVVNDPALAIEGNRCVRVYRKDKKDGEVLWTAASSVFPRIIFRRSIFLLFPRALRVVRCETRLGGDAYVGSAPTRFGNGRAGI